MPGRTRLPQELQEPQILAPRASDRPQVLLRAPPLVQEPRVLARLDPRAQRRAPQLVSTLRALALPLVRPQVRLVSTPRVLVRRLGLALKVLDPLLVPRQARPPVRLVSTPRVLAQQVLVLRLAQELRV